MPVRGLARRRAGEWRVLHRYDIRNSQVNSELVSVTCAHFESVLVSVVLTVLTRSISVLFSNAGTCLQSNLTKIMGRYAYFRCSLALIFMHFAKIT